ncbi:hypothetical protein TorRG33x02_163250, partial [Trema orientale]
DDTIYSDGTRSLNTSDDFGGGEDPIGGESRRANRRWNFLENLIWWSRKEKMMRR